MTTIDIQSLIERGALFVANHSGGKDSQAMLIKLLEIVPRSQLLVVHASLGEVEWEGALELAQDQAKAAGVPFIVARANFKDGSAKTFLNKAEHQFARRPDAPSFPSINNRWCTGELKTGPIEREIRRYVGPRGIKLIVNCIGERAAESTERRNRPAFEQRTDKDDGLARAGREAYNWRPIHALSTAEVFATITDAGQQPHPAYGLVEVEGEHYAAGNERLSCVFCFLGSCGDLAHGAKAYPALYAKYTELEQRTGYSLHMSGKSLTQLVAEATL